MASIIGTSSTSEESDAYDEPATTSSDSESESGLVQEASHRSRRSSAKRPPGRSGHAPDRSLQLKPLDRKWSIPPRPHELRLFFPIQLEENKTPSYEWLRMDSLSNFKKACALYGPTSPYCKEYLTGWSKKAHWVPQDFHVVAKTCLSPSQYIQWRMWFSDEAKAKLQSLGHAGQKFSGIKLTYEMLIGEGKWHDPKKQVTLPRAVFAHVRDAALWAWERIDADAEFKESYTKIIQGATEPYADFIGRLMEAIERQY